MYIVNIKNFKHMEISNPTDPYIDNNGNNTGLIYLQYYWLSIPESERVNYRQVSTVPACNSKYWKYSNNSLQEMTQKEKERVDFEDTWECGDEKYRLIGSYPMLKQYGGTFMSDLVVKKILNIYKVEDDTLHVYLNFIKPADLVSLKQIPTVTIQDFDTEQYL